MVDKQSEGLKLLREIKNINRMIEEMQMQIDEIYTMLTSTTVKPKLLNVQTSGSNDPIADKMCKVLEYQESIQNYQKELCEKKMLALNIIKQMDIELQQIIVLRYYKCYSIESIGDQIGYTYRWAWEKLHQAEEQFLTIYEKNT